MSDQPEKPVGQPVEQPVTAYPTIKQFGAVESQESPEHDSTLNHSAVISRPDKKRKPTQEE